MEIGRTAKIEKNKKRESLAQRDNRQYKTQHNKPKLGPISVPTSPSPVLSTIGVNSGSMNSDWSGGVGACAMRVITTEASRLPSADRQDRWVRPKGQKRTLRLGDGRNPRKSTAPPRLRKTTKTIATSAYCETTRA
jgi:hypothetical protein